MEGLAVMTGFRGLASMLLLQLSQVRYNRKALDVVLRELSGSLEVKMER